ncbi:MAG: hypothetical protein Q9188_007575 [Gyalolechia gomerana]
MSGRIATKTDSDMKNSLHDPKTSHDVAENLPRREFSQQREYDTNFSALFEQLVTVEKKELESRIATAEAARAMLQNLERILASRRNLSGVDANAVGGWGIADLQSEDPRSWNTIGRQILQEILPPSMKDSGSNPSLPTTFLMAIHGPEGKTIMHVAKLDTGSKQNLISRKLTTSIGLRVEAYTGLALQPIGALISPTAQVTFDWHVSERQPVHRTTFTILEETSHLGFDILLSEQEIQKHRFYVRNHEVFYIQ